MLADRGLVTMTTPFMRSYSLQHDQDLPPAQRARHGRHGRADPDQERSGGQRAALDKVRQDKLREVTDGHDGTWVAHPGAGADRAGRVRRGDAARQPDRPPARGRERHRGRPAGLRARSSPITEQGLRWNINVGVQYLGAWLGGSGAVPIFNLMEDAATARSPGAGLAVDQEPAGRAGRRPQGHAGLFRQMLGEELGKMQQDADPEVYANSKYPLAAEILDRITCNDIECEGKFSDFLTLPAYEYLD